MLILLCLLYLSQQNKKALTTDLERSCAKASTLVLFGLWSMVFPEYVSFRKALRAVQQDARDAQVGALLGSPSPPLQPRQPYNTGSAGGVDGIGSDTQLGCGFL
jgi:hypothetical protein